MSFGALSSRAQSGYPPVYHFSEYDCRSTLAEHEGRDGLTSDDESEIEEAQRTLGIITKPKSYVNDFFPHCGQDPEISVSLHNDLSQHNILLNEDGNLTGVPLLSRRDAPPEPKYIEVFDGALAKGDFYLAI
ncbi:hypothetical protein DL765_010389 [Monosporascus sp. GIB2]|nr:hypothetical protein DL765_010389 [Monosporascus sp. GIB2]